MGVGSKIKLFQGAVAIRAIVRRNISETSETGSVRRTPDFH